MKNIDSKGARDIRAFIKRCIHPTHFQLGVKLVIQKLANVFKESRLREVTSKSVDAFGVASS